MTRVARAPGRVNLLGEHTDYNDGFVLPVAIDRFTTVEASEQQRRPRQGRGGRSRRDRSLPLDLIERTGTVARLRSRCRTGDPRPGRERTFVSRARSHEAAGLSSSAALEVAVGRALSDLPGPELAILCRRAENEFVGVQCGIMDPFTVANARDGHALLLDCRDLSFRHIPMARRRDDRRLRQPRRATPDRLRLQRTTRGVRAGCRRARRFDSARCAAPTSSAHYPSSSAAVPGMSSPRTPAPSPGRTRSPEVTSRPSGR